MPVTYGYTKLYKYTTFNSKYPVGTALFVADVFTTLGSMADIVTTAYLGDTQLVSGQMDIAADAAQLVQLALLVNTFQECAGGEGIEELLMVMGLAQSVIIALEQLNGFGPPEDGSKFTAGAATFDDAGWILGQAYSAPDQWSDTGAEKYSLQNTAQLARVTGDVSEDMAWADRWVARYMSLQADEVKTGREMLASARVAILAAWLPALMLAGYCWATAAVTGGQGFWQAFKTFVYLAVGGAGVVALSGLGVQIGQGLYNARQLQSAIDVYSDIADQAGQIVSSSTPARVAAGADTPWPPLAVSGFSDLSSRTSAVPDMFGWAANSPDKHAPAGPVLGEDAGEGEGPQYGAPAEPQTPQSPVFTQPAVGGFGSLPGAAAKGSGRTDLVSRIVGPVPQHIANGPQAPDESAADEEAVGVAGLGRPPIPLEVGTADVEQARH